MSCGPEHVVVVGGQGDVYSWGRGYKGEHTVFWIKSRNGTFLALQIKTFGQRKIKFHAGIKKSHFDNFSEWAGMAVPC